MPRSAPSCCTEPGCPELVHEPKRSRCTEHYNLQKANQSRSYKGRDDNAQYVAFYASPTWRKLSTNYRKHNPLCVHCLEIGITKPADLVDHIKEVRDLYAERLNIDNLQSLCHSCHNTKTAMVRRQSI